MLLLQSRPTNFPYLCPRDESLHRGAGRKNGDEESPGNAEHLAS